jgi:hypothetical protein
MNCQKFEDFIDDIARDQMIEVSARDEALAHGRECQSCERRLEDERRLTQHLRAFAVVASADAPERVEARLIDAFEQRAILESRRFATGRRSWIAAAAAALLIVAGLLGIRWRLAGSATPGRNPATVTNTKTPVNRDVSPNATKTVKLEPRSMFQRPRAVLRHRRPSESAAKANSTSTPKQEIATNFIPVNYGGLSLDEGGRMVRVELPRSAMASFGLPVNMDRANERVKADVLFGADGLAHAIRFIQ